MISKKAAALLGASAIAGIATVAPAQAAENVWKGEITPYLWTVGVDGDVTVGDREVSVDVGFDDVLDVTDAAGSVLGVLQYGRLVFWGQVDYLSVSTDELDNAPARGSLDSDSTIATLAVGYKFGDPNGKTYDLMIGARRISLENTLELNGIGRFEREQDFTDAVVVFRPSIPLSQRWRFNPTLSFGTGDSEKTYEMWPQLQYRAMDHLALRLGYRRLFYDIEGDSGNKFDASFSGWIIGVGGIW